MSNQKNVVIKTCDCGRYDGETHAHYHLKNGERSQPIFTLGGLLIAVADDIAANLIDELDVAEAVLAMIDVLPQQHRGMFVYGVAAMEAASKEALAARPHHTKIFEYIGGFIQLVVHEETPQRPSAAA